MMFSASLEMGGNWMSGSSRLVPTSSAQGMGERESRRELKPNYLPCPSTRTSLAYFNGLSPDQK